MLRAVATSFAFLTRLPVRTTEAGPMDMAAAAAWFPLVGAVVGGVVGAVHYGLQQLMPTSVAAAVAVAVGVLITGAFHEDGLGDTADGFGGGWTPEERLKIMADPRQGTYGVAAIVCSVLVRVAAIGAMEGATAIAVVCAAHLLARNLAAMGLGLARPANRGGLAGSMRADAEAKGTTWRRTSLTATAWMVVFFLIVGSTLGPIAAVSMALVASGVGLAVVRLARAKVGGVTGDVLGAIEQLAESAALVAATAFVPF